MSPFVQKYRHASCPACSPNSGSVHIDFRAVSGMGYFVWIVPSMLGLSVVSLTCFVLGIVQHALTSCYLFTHFGNRLVGLVVKASASKAEDPGFESRLQRDFSGVKSYQWLKNWHSSGYPAKLLALWGRHWDWWALCHYIVTGWGTKFDLQLLSQCGSM